MTDKSKLAQVLKNLLSNAIKFTKEGFVRLSMEKQGDNLLIQVTDSGIGIAEDKIGTIFEAFKQVDGSISREFGGTGLGLSISKTIVDLMNGEISVNSKLEEGTIFNVSLPLIKEYLEKNLEVEPQSIGKVVQASVLSSEVTNVSTADEFLGKKVVINIFNF
ncbi:MAG: ATP-binding protein [Flavobacteriaceae bacterium]